MAEDDTASNSNIIRAEEVDKDIMETIDEMDGDIKIGIHSNTTGRVDMDILAAVIRYDSKFRDCMLRCNTCSEWAPEREL